MSNILMCINLHDKNNNFSGIVVLSFGDLYILSESLQNICRAIEKFSNNRFSFQ